MLPKFKSQTQIIVLDVDIKAWLFVEIMVDYLGNMKRLTVQKRKLINRQKYPKRPKIYLPKLSTQAQKFGILMKKGFIGRP